MADAVAAPLQAGRGGGAVPVLRKAAAAVGGLYVPTAVGARGQGGAAETVVQLLHLHTTVLSTTLGSRDNLTLAYRLMQNDLSIGQFSMMPADYTRLLLGAMLSTAGNFGRF